MHPHLLIRHRDASLVVTSLIVVAWLAVVFTTGFHIGWGGRTTFEIAGDILEGTWFSDVHLLSATYFAPGYPLLLAAMSKVTGMSLIVAAKVCAAIGWLALLVGMRTLFRDLGGRPGGAWEWVCLGFVALSPQVLILHELVLPEPLYMAGCVWTLVVVERYARRPTIGLGVALVLLAGAVVGLRYAGVGLAGAASLRLLLQGGWSWKQRIGSAVLPGIGVLALVAWLFVEINAGHGTSPTTVPEKTFDLGDIWNSVASFGSHFVLGINFSEDEVLVSSALDPLVRLACFATAAITIATLGWLTWSHRDRSEASPVAGVLSGLRRRGLLSVALYAVGTIAFLSVWRFRTGYMILPRYWTPVVLPLLAATLAVYSRGRLGTPLIRRLAPIAAGAVLAALTLMSLYNVANPREDPPRYIRQIESSSPPTVSEAPS